MDSRDDSGALELRVKPDRETWPLHARGPSTSCLGCGSTVATPRCEGCGTTRQAGRYLTVRVIGQRPFSRTYLAYDPKHDQHVVLKELWFAQVPGVEALDAFERETDLLANVAHRRIPRLLKSFRVGEGRDLRQYLVREHIRGQSLASIYQRRRIAEGEVRHVARQVLRVLTYLHAQHPPIIHRDLRPHHLLRHPNGDIYLLGFGAARWIEEGLTFNGTLIGEPGYASFEQLGGTLEPSADLHGLGAALLHLLTGADPFSLMPDGQHLEIPPLAVSASFTAFLGGLLAPIGQRFESAEAAYAALTGRHRLADALEKLAAWLRRR